MRTVDPESQAFMAWVDALALDEQWFHEFKKEAVRKAANFLSYPNDQLRDSLREKLIKGALEHGAPSEGDYDVEQELQSEYLDMLGWGFLKLWREKHAREKRGA